MWGSLSSGSMRANLSNGLRLCMILGLAAGLGCALPGVVKAQVEGPEVAPEYLYYPDLFGASIPRGETVRSRARPELDPLGIHLGSFYFYPSVTNSITYDDNVFATDGGEKSDFIYRLSPSMHVQSDWNNHSLSVSSGGDFGFYFDETGENYRDAFAAASGRIDVRSSTSVNGNLEVRRSHEARGDPDDVGGAEPTVFYSFSGGGSVSHRINRMTLTGGADVRHYTYDDTEAAGGGTIDNSGRDYTLYRPGLQVGYEFLPGYTAFVRGEGQIVRYDKTVGATRDSQGYDLVGGASLDLTGLLFGDVFAGWRQRFYDSSTFDTLSGPVVGARMTWIPTGLTTVILNIENQVVESVQIGSSGYTSSSIGLTVDHELLRNLILTGGGGFRYDDFEGISRTDKFFTTSVGADYLWNRYFSLGARYQFSHRDSDVSGADYTNNVVSLLLSAHL